MLGERFEERPLIFERGMKIDFVQEIVEDEGPPRITGCLTGWESIVFEVEDDAEAALTRTADQKIGKCA